jgi:aryl-alcohol dehydrogenase-like predicted oxidoreductase
MSDAYGAAEESRSLQTMRTAVEQGINFFDTADMYGRGHNEALIGRFLREFGRGNIIVGTKFGSIPAEPGGEPKVDNSPEHIVSACEASLKRLGVETIDLYYMHRRDPHVPIEESVGAMARLVEAGKVRALGLSEISAATLRKANAIHPIAALQSEYSLWFRDPEQDVLPTCAELGITFVPFSPLGRAFLTGTLTQTTFETRDIRSSLPRFQGEAAVRNRELVAQMGKIAARKDISSAQLALAWLLSKNKGGQTIVPIPGTKRPEYVQENARAAKVVLSTGEVGELEALFSPTSVGGERYSAIEAARAGT